MSPVGFHETVSRDDAARRLARAVAGSGTSASAPREGRVELIAAQDGLLKVNKAALHRVNGLRELVVATRHSNLRVHKGQPLGGFQVIPPELAPHRVALAERLILASGSLVLVKPLHNLRVAIVHLVDAPGRGDEQTMDRILPGKVEELGCVVLGQVVASGHSGEVAQAVETLIAEGAQMVLATGCTYDPDSEAADWIQAIGGRVIAYGVPVFPGPLFLLAQRGEVWILGLPGSVFENRTTIFDLVVPRLLAGESLTKSELGELGHGGFCSDCRPCVYPHCPLGKGS